MGTKFFSDYERWVHFFEDHQLLNCTPKQLEAAQALIIQEQDPVLAYFFYDYFQLHAPKMQKVILQSRNAKYAFLFALKNKNADLASIQSLLFQSQSYHLIFRFVTELQPQSHLQAFKFAYQKRQIKLFMQLLKRFPLKNLSPYTPWILQQKNNYICDLAIYTQNPKIIQQATRRLIQTQDYKHLCKLLKKQKLANVAEIEACILASESPTWIRKMAQASKDCSLRKFLLMG